MYQPRPAEQSTFDSHAQYNLQATEDIDERHSLDEKKFPVVIPKRPNYRPKPLRWPFIAFMIVLLSALMALVIVARTKMPNSDNNAEIERRHLLVVRQDEPPPPSVAPQTSPVIQPTQALQPSPSPQPSPAPEPSPSPPPVNSQPASQPAAPGPSTPPAASSAPPLVPSTQPAAASTQPALTQEIVAPSTADLPKSESQPPVTPTSPAAVSSDAPRPQTVTEVVSSAPAPSVPASSAPPVSEKKEEEWISTTEKVPAVSTTEQKAVSTTQPDVKSSGGPSATVEESNSAIQTPSAPSSASQQAVTLKEVATSQDPTVPQTVTTTKERVVSKETAIPKETTTSQGPTASKEDVVSKESTSSRENASSKETTASADVVSSKETVLSRPPTNSKEVTTSPESASSKPTVSPTDITPSENNKFKIPSTQSRTTSLGSGGISETTEKPTSSKTDASSTDDLSGQRKAPPPITTTISVSKSSSPPYSATKDGETITVITSEFTSTITKPGSTIKYTTTIVTNSTLTYTTTFQTVIPGTTGVTTYTRTLTTSIPRTITKTPSAGYSMTTMTIPDTQTKIETVSDDSSTFEQTVTKTVGRVTVSSAPINSAPVIETSYEQVTSTIIATSAFTAPAKTTAFTSVVVSAVPTAVPTVITTAMPGQVYVQVGTTEITKVITVPRDRNSNPQTQPPVVNVFTSVIDGRVQTIVDNPAAQTIVTNDGGVVSVVYTPPPETRVTRNGGQETQMVVVVTPSPNAAYIAVQTTIGGTPTVVMVQSTFGAAPVMKEVATTINGKATVVNVPATPEPVTAAVQTTIDGKPTVVLVKSTPSAGAFNPVTLNLVSRVGGVTGVFTTQDGPDTIKTAIDGKETTIVRTPPPRVFTSVSGGTPTTIQVVTTPTGTLPFSMTVITTIGGTLSTIVSTPSPTTIVTSISGKLRTFTSTPKPTTRLSTIKPSTMTITSTSRPTSTGSADTVITQVEKFSFTSADYFVGKFLPVILAVMIAVPLRVIDLNAKLYQPFYALARDGGALGSSSMTLHFDGWRGFLAPFDVLLQGHPVPFISTLIIWCSSFLAPLATEAIGMKLHGKCKITAIDGCAIQLGVSTMSAHALVALLALIIVLLLVLLYFLRNWETGLHANPWSIAGISSLARNPEIRSLQLDFKASKKAMAEKRYGFGYFENNLGREEYGIVYYDDSAHSLQGAAASGALGADDEMTGAYQRDIARKARKPVPFIALTYWWRLLFMFFLASLFVIILYYHLTLHVRTSFKDFMDSQSFGVRFFFAALGVIIIFCWESIFVSIAIISPYRHMARHSQPPEKSILLSRPTNSVYGVYAAIMEGNAILMLGAFMSILAEFLPILFANIPYNLTQTLISHNVCARISLAILALMLICMVASLFIKWPDMPVDPRSIAGAMYYVNESRMLEDFEGLSKMDSKERAKRVKEIGRRYFYGGVTGTYGKRMGVESVESVEDTAYTGGHWFMPPQRREGHDDHQSHDGHLEERLNDQQQHREECPLPEVHQQEHRPEQEQEEIGVAQTHQEVQGSSPVEQGIQEVPSIEVTPVNEGAPPAQGAHSVQGGLI